MRWTRNFSLVAAAGLAHAAAGPAPADPGASRTIDPTLGTRTPASARTRALADRGLLAVHVYTDPARRGAVARALGADATLRRASLAGDLSVLAIETTEAAARRIATMPGVVWVEAAPDPTLRNGTLREVVQSGAVGATPFDDAGLTGAGQVVGVIDDPLDWDHCAFADSAPIGPSHRKIVAYNAPLGAVSAHGTHVSGTLAGDSDAHPDLRGVAPGARLAFDTIPAFDEATLYEQFETHASQGARTHSLSWGDEQSAVYGGLARAVDAFCWTNDEHLVVVACANQETLKTPENAKSALAVSATLDSPFQDRFCVGPTGPTPDGRRKPELVAPGCSIFSAYPFGAGCPTVFSSGTSMATPAVAGAAAIVRQYLEEGWHIAGEANPAAGFEPLGPLVKAVLIAGATDLSDEPGWPGDREGWGRVTLSGALPLTGSDPARLLVEQRRNNGGDAIGHGGSRAVRVEVTDPSRPLRVVLSWHDAPGDLGSGDPVVNDLDLIITGPSGTIFVGNDVDPLTGASVARTDPSGIADTRNTTEVIALPAPAAGEYTITIAGTSVPVGAQGYGLAVVGGAVWSVPAACGDADLAEPLGVLDLADINAFVSAFVARDPSGDLTGDGVFDLSDINAFVGAFAEACP